MDVVNLTEQHNNAPGDGRDVSPYREALSQSKEIGILLPYIQDEISQAQRDGGLTGRALEVRRPALLTGIVTGAAAGFA